jgi:hypothetical protein
MERIDATYADGFRLGWDGALDGTRKAYSKMRTEIVDALSPSSDPAKTYKRILDALNGFQAQVDGNFDLD